MPIDRKYFNQLLEASDDAIKSYDKTLITMSAGGIAVTLTFVSDLFEKQGLNCSASLISGLVCWGLTIAATLVSFFVSHVANRKALTLEATGTSTPEQHDSLRKPWNRAIFICNIVSGILFLAGLVGMLAFVGSNLPTAVS